MGVELTPSVLLARTYRTSHEHTESAVHAAPPPLRAALHSTKKSSRTGRTSGANGSRGGGGVLRGKPLEVHCVAVHDVVFGRRT